MYSDVVPMGQAVEAAFVHALSQYRQMEEAAMILRRNMKDTFQESANSPWPPSASYLQSKADNIPDLLNHFLSYLLAGKNPGKTSAKVTRLCSSLGQDICYAFSKDQCKTAKDS